MRSLRQPLALLLVLLTPLMLTACAAARPPIEHPALAECGGPMAEQVANRAAGVAYEQASKGASLEQVKTAIAGEIKAVAAEQGPELVACLVDKALNAYRAQAVLPKRLRLAAPTKDLVLTASLGFVPLERDPVHARPWHTLLAGARGVRS